MSIIEKLIEEIDDSIATYRTKNGNMPKHLILSVEHRQAIKLLFQHTHKVPSEMIKTFAGIPVIHLEDSIILSTKQSQEMKAEPNNKGGE